MFIGRNSEITDLEKRLGSPRFEMIPIYGRRRVGKTRLVEEFTRDKKTIFFTANQFGEESNLKNLSQVIAATLFGSFNKQMYPSFQDAFLEIAHQSEKINEPIIFVIDEYPYLAQSNMGISSVLQWVIDKYFLKIPQLMLILTGSQMSFMKRQVLGYESPLYGRRTGQIRLLPLGFAEAREFLPSLPINEFLTIFGITGGIPLYLTMMNDSYSLVENIKEYLLKPSTLLYEEPENLLMQELRTPNRYNDVLIAIANGATQLNEISNQTGIDSGSIIKYINTLIDLNILEKREPLTRIGKRKPIYVIQDGLFHFWYRYVPKYKSFIERKQMSSIWSRIEEDLILFTSLIFEDFCREWLYLNSEILLKEVGSWWGNNPLIKDSSSNAEEVDVVGVGLEAEELVVGECKWRNEPTGLDVGKKLIQRAQFFPYNKKELYVFSKSEFTEELKEYAAKNSIILLTFKEMVSKLLSHSAVE